MGEVEERLRPRRRRRGGSGSSLRTASVWSAIECPGFYAYVKRD